MKRIWKILHLAATASGCRPMAAEELGHYITGRAPEASAYKFSELVLGIDSERRRLGARPFLVVVSQEVSDYDGSTHCTFLQDSAAGRSDAIRKAGSLAETLLERQLASRPNSGHTHRWTLDSEGDAPWLPKPLSDANVVTQFQRSFRVRASPYDTMYTTVRAVGPFRGEPLDRALVDYLNSRFSLWSYLVDVGESVMGRRDRPHPN